MKIALSIALAAAFIAAFIFQQNALNKERAERERLLARQQQLPATTDVPTPTPAADSEGAAHDRSELERLRAESAALQSQIAEIKSRPQNNTPSSATKTPGTAPAIAVIRTTDAHDAGQGTPADLVQTTLWALLHGDTNRFFSMLALSPDTDMTKVQEMLQMMRREFDEKGTDGMLTNGPGDIRIVDDQVAQNNDHWLVTSETHSDGSPGSPERVLIRWTDSGWRLVIGTNGEPVSEPINNQQ